MTAVRAGLRADAFLFLELPFLSRTRVRQKIQTGECLLNGGRFATSARMREGDVVAVRWRGPAPGASGPEELPVAVLFEDEHLMGVDKPAGVAAHPAGSEQTATLVQRARAAHRALTDAGLARGDASFYPSLVNRLDRFTSGVILVAKTRGALLSLQRLAAEGGISKEYLAVVEGVVGPDEGRLDGPIGPASASAIGVRMEVRPDGKPAVTLFSVVRRLPAHTVLRLRPLTGRTHQIRVHLAAAGHPVWGDLLYRDESLFLRYWEAGRTIQPGMPPRHLLHAERAAFRHPVTGSEVEIVSPLPPDFTALLGALEGV